MKNNQPSEPTPKEITELAEKLVQTIKPILAGRGPDVQGVILCELTAIWLAGHTPLARESLIQMHMEAVRGMIPMCEEELFGPEGHPDKRTQQ